MVALSVFATVPVILEATYAKEMKMQESSYAPVMIAKSFEAVREQDMAEKPEVMAKHMALLKERYDLSGKTDPNARMSGGKPLPVGPTAKLMDGITWEGLGGLMLPEEIRQKGVFPYSPLPHAIRLRTIPTTSRTISRWSVSTMDAPRDLSRPLPCAGSMTPLHTCTMEDV